MLTRHRLGLPRVRNQKNVAIVAGTSKRVPSATACLSTYLPKSYPRFRKSSSGCLFVYLSSRPQLLPTVLRYNIKVANSTLNVCLAVDNIEAVHCERRMMWHHKTSWPDGDRLPCSCLISSFHDLRIRLTILLTTSLDTFHSSTCSSIFN